MTTPTLEQLKAELDQLTKSMGAVNPALVTVEEWKTFRAKVKALETMVGKMEKKSAERP